MYTKTELAAFKMTEIEKGEWIINLKKMCSSILDDIEVQMSTTKLKFTGNMNIDDIMQLWGNLISPALFLTRLKYKKIESDDIDILRTSITAASEAAEKLSSEIGLNIKDELPSAYRDVLKSLEESKLHNRSFHVDKNFAIVAHSLKNMQCHTGVHFDDRYIQKVLNSINIITHLSAESGDGVHGVDGVQLSEIEYSFQKEKSDIVVVSLQHFSEEIAFEDVLHETATSLLKSPPPESLGNISRGILFSDLETGIACIAVSALAELGAEIDEDGTSLIVNKTNSFFNETFIGVPSHVDSIAVLRRSWDPSPDCDLGFEY